MNAKELDALRKNTEIGELSQIELTQKALEHIDEQARKIEYYRQGTIQGQETHAQLAAILGTDDALHVLATKLKAKGVEQAKQIAELKEEADCTDIFDALEDAGIPMGTNEEPQDIITAIGILGDRIATLKAVLTKERALAIQDNPNRTHEWTHEQACERAREQLAVELPDIFGEGTQ